MERIANPTDLMRSIAVDCDQSKALAGCAMPTVVEALAKFCLMPIYLEEEALGARRCKMWITNQNAFEISVPPVTLKSRVSTVEALVQRDFQQLIFTRGKFNEALSDMMLCGPLVAFPMADVFSLTEDPLCCLASDQETKCVKNDARIPLLVKQQGKGEAETEGAEKDIFLFFLKPDIFAYVVVKDIPILLFNFENKHFATAENLDTGAKTALLQYSYLRGIGIDELVVPFMTMNGHKISLYGLVDTEYWLIEQWDVATDSQAFDCLGTMYRLAQWLCDFARRVGEAANSNSLVSGLQELVRRLSKSHCLSTGTPRSRKSLSQGKSGSPRSMERGSNDAQGDEERHAMEAELRTVLHGARFTRSFLPTCHPASRGGGIIFDPVPAPWHYCVDPKRWLKVHAASRADEAEHESQVMRELHRVGVGCIPELHEVLHFSNGCVGLLMADCGSSLRQPMSETELIDFATRAASCLAELHTAGWVHGDVKESNFCRNDADGRVTLIDLEYAVRVGSVPPGYTCDYRAPEAESRKNRRYSTHSDMYSFGVMLRHLSEALGHSFGWGWLIKALTLQEPSRRPSAAQVVAELQTRDSESPERIERFKGDDEPLTTSRDVMFELQTAANQTTLAK